MKKRFLKDYNNYLNEHFAVFFNKDETINKIEKEISEDGIQKNEDCGCKTEEHEETCDKSKKSKESKTSEMEEYEEDFQDEYPQESQQEYKEEPKEEPSQTNFQNNFQNKLQDVTSSYEHDPTSTSPKEFSVVKVMTNNGERIMMCYTCDAEEYTSLSDNLDFKSACNIVEKECELQGLDKFNNAKDVDLGGIPSYMKDKKKKDFSTSYKPK